MTLIQMRMPEIMEYISIGVKVITAVVQSHKSNSLKITQFKVLCKYCTKCFTTLYETFALHEKDNRQFEAQYVSFLIIALQKVHLFTLAVTIMNIVEM